MGKTKKFNVGPGRVSFKPSDGSPEVDLGSCSGFSVNFGETSALIDKTIAELRSRVRAGETVEQVYASRGVEGVE
jgi:hypothetical protein